MSPSYEAIARKRWKTSQTVQSQQFGGFRSDQHSATRTSQPAKPRSSKRFRPNTTTLKPRIRARKKPLSLDLHRLLSLPLNALERICAHLPPADILTLASMPGLLRAFFFSDMAWGCWNLVREQSGYPTWSDVPLRQYMTFIFKDRCQGTGCNNPAPLKLYQLAQRYCSQCSSKLLISRTDALALWPDLPACLIGVFPRSKKRLRPDSMFETGLFYSKRDVSRIATRYRTLDPRDLRSLEKLLSSIWWEEPYPFVQNAKLVMNVDLQCMRALEVGRRKAVSNAQHQLLKRHIHYDVESLDQIIDAGFAYHAQLVSLEGGRKALTNLIVTHAATVTRAKSHLFGVNRPFFLRKPNTSPPKIALPLA